MEDDHITHAHDEVARRLFGQQGREFFLLLLEFHEFDLHQFMLRQGGIYGSEEAFTQAGFANFEHRVQKLGGGFEFPKFRIGQWFEHGTRSLSAAAKKPIGIRYGSVGGDPNQRSAGQQIVERNQIGIRQMDAPQRGGLAQRSLIAKTMDVDVA